MSIFLKKRRDGTTAWFYDFTHNNRRYRAVGGGSKTQALRTLEKVRNQVISGEYEILEQIGHCRLKDFAKTFLSRRQFLKSRKRDELSTRTLLMFFESETLDSISADKIEDYIAHRKNQNVANGTINRELSCLKRMYNLAIRWKETKRNPVKDVDFLKENPGRTRFLSADEAQALLSHCGPCLRVIVFTALNTGMRLSEILGLTWDRVHIQSVMDPYFELIQTKNNKNRFVPLNEEMVDLVSGIEKKNPTFVFIGERGKPLKSVKKPFIAALKRAGILNFRFHDLRHTFASHFVMNGGDLLTLKEILGHSSMKMVERYAHLASSHKRRQVNNLSKVFKICHPNATCNKVVNFNDVVSQ